MMAKELEESKKEKERLVAFEREVGKRREEGVVGKDALAKEIAKVSRAGSALQALRRKLMP